MSSWTEYRDKVERTSLPQVLVAAGLPIVQTSSVTHFDGILFIIALICSYISCSVTHSRVQNHRSFYNSLAACSEKSRNDSARKYETLSHFVLCRDGLRLEFVFYTDDRTRSNGLHNYYTPAGT
jgi:hypothetical protein